MNRTQLTFAPILATTLFGSLAAQAQEPDGLQTTAPVTGGTTDVAQEGFQAVEKPSEGKDTTQLSVSAGGLFTSGNARSMALTGMGDLKLRRDVHQFSSQLAANYGRAAIERGEPTETSVENYQARARYDYFITDAVAAFLSVSGRRDRFQGLDLRLNVDPGLAYYFIDKEKHQLWGELGYDLQHDVRRDENLAAAEADGIILDKSETRHHGRAFVGYDNKLNQTVTFNTGLEYLQGITETENWRLNWDARLTSSISDAFSIATSFTLKYDNNPLPEIEELDTVTAVNLVYSLL